MDDFYDISDISRLVRMAVAPVFLLTGIGSIINVISSRTGRIVDRARVLETMILSDKSTPLKEEELRILLRRLRLGGWAVSLCVGSAILISAVVAMMFLGGLLHIDPYEWIGLFFVLAMVLLISGLILFFLEIREGVRYSWLGRSRR